MTSTTEVRNTVRATPVGVCIYCGATNRLTDEHIVPFALGGRFVLPKSSCSICATITSKFERRVLRGFMLDARTTGEFPTRRPKKRPKSLSLKVEREGTFQSVKLSPSEHPGFLQLPLLVPPGVLAGREPSTGVSIMGNETIRFGKDPSEVAKDLGTLSIRLSTDFDITSFARLIAKIGYSYAIAELGLLPREQVPVLPIILGTADDVSVWLGSAHFQLAIEAKKPMHAMSLAWVPDPSNNMRNFLVARIKLFASSGATGYEVVVYRPQGLAV